MHNRQPAGPFPVHTHEPFKVADPRIDLENTYHARRDARITRGAPPTANQRCQAGSVLLDRRQSRSQWLLVTETHCASGPECLLHDLIGHGRLWHF
jgi:hypothetical protein